MICLSIAAAEHVAPLILQRKVSPHVKEMKKEKGINGVIWPHSNNDVEGLAVT